MEDLKFRISSALKSIIGKDLISDQYIAIFELVKNSYDADASRVDIYFNNIYSDTDQGKIVIADDGKGMTYKDIIDKWLFVAYSAKKEGIEDHDYRNKIHTHRQFAGAKGIGRFSCDKLGRYLQLETKRENDNAHLLLTDWKLFEANSSEEFVDVEVQYEELAKSKTEIDTSGTILTISDLRSDEIAWNRNKLLKLKASLAKLIQPKLGENTTYSSDFEIYLHVPEEEAEDKHQESYHKRVNGKIENFIFERLNVKTTKIRSKIAGNKITTELIDGNTLVYRITESNNLEISDVEYILYYLNRSAKITFTKAMGVQSVNYGHVFLYRKGFRVYPYGEPGEDPLKIDARKQQGYSRFIGTRELIGSINIESSNEGFRETTSRGDGLIQTEEYDQLVNYFYTVLKRLELYVVEVQKWGISIEDDDSNSLKARISHLLAKLTGSDDILDLETGPNFLDFLELSQDDSVEAVVNNLNRLALETGNENLISQAKEAQRKLKLLQGARREAENQADEQREKAAYATEELKKKISENLFLKSINSGDYEEVISLLHHIGIYAGTIDNNLRGISLRVQNDIPLSNLELINIIKSISFETKKIINISAFATKANFKLDTEFREVDVLDYIKQYIENIIPTVTDRSIKIKVADYGSLAFVKKIKPIELNIVLDNLINNAKKAGANMLEVLFEIPSKEVLNIKFRDNGKGIDQSIIPQMFNLGTTTTDGSGIGLYHVKKIVDSLDGRISGYNNSNEGATFEITLKA